MAGPLKRRRHRPGVVTCRRHGDWMVVNITLPRVLLTGATGYIGSRLLARLVSDGYPTGAVLRPSSDIQKLGAKRDDVSVIRHDGTTAALLAAVTDFGPDIVVHLAAMSGATHRPEDIRPYLEANLIFGAEVVEAATLAGCRGVIATSTFWEHGDGTADYEPNSLYAASKRAFQDILTFYARSRAISAVILKPTDVYGPDDPRHRLLDQLLTAQATAVPLDLSPGKQLLDLVHVDDVLAAYLRAIRLVLAPEPLTGSYAVGTGRHLNIQEIVALCEQVTGGDIPVRWGARPYRSIEVFHPWRGPYLPGWRPRIPLEEGIARLAAAHRATTYTPARVMC